MLTYSRAAKIKKILIEKTNNLQFRIAKIKKMLIDKTNNLHFRAAKINNACSKKQITYTSGQIR
jgi:hypothetical protein